MSHLQPEILNCSHKGYPAEVPLYCLPIKARTMKDLEEKILEGVVFADIIEIWLCELKDMDLEFLKNLQSKIKKPFLYVLKPKNENGKFVGTHKQKVELLIKSLDYGASYVDIGVKTNKILIKKLIREAKKKKVKVIISYHNFKKTPSSGAFRALYLKMKNLNPDIIKFATYINKPNDIASLFNLIIRSQKESQPIITLGMGEKGKITRILAPKLGNYLYYAPIRQKYTTADGQMTYTELINYWK
ncbi:MAG: type I 3-dehydroquinate dehydratase [Candidatus Gracilibacteria bacterium]